MIDFGDMHHGWIASEAAIAAAYAILGKEDPLALAKEIVRGFHSAFPLNEAEIAATFPLVGMRLAVSVVNSAIRKVQKPADDYVTVSEDGAWSALEQLAKIHPRFAHYSMRAACGLRAVPTGEKVKSYLRQVREPRRESDGSGCANCAALRFRSECWQYDAGRQSCQR